MLPRLRASSGGELLLRGVRWDVAAGVTVCLLLDVHMPEMNGVQLYEMLAVARHTLPVIMMTGRDDAPTRHLLQRMSPVAVLIKPFDESLLLDAIFRALALARTFGGKC